MWGAYDTKPPIYHNAKRFTFMFQSATGGIIDLSKPSSRLSLTEAVSAGLIEKRIVQRLSNAEKAFKGFPDRHSNSIIPLGPAIKRGLCYYESGTRLLEFQCITGACVCQTTAKTSRLRHGSDTVEKL